MENKIIALTKERALVLARLALIQDKVLIIEDSLNNTTYRERKLGLGDQNRGWTVCAKLDLVGHWDPDLVFVSVSDPDEKVKIQPIL